MTHKTDFMTSSMKNTMVLNGTKTHLSWRQNHDHGQPKLIAWTWSIIKKLKVKSLSHEDHGSNFC